MAHHVVAVLFDLSDDTERGEYIRMMLGRHGLSVAQLAQEYGITRATLSNIIRQVSRSKKIEKGLARRLDMDPDILWPGRNYGEERLTAV